MSPKENQGDGGCVTVEYSTEEKRELYDVGNKADVEGAPVNRTHAAAGGSMTWIYRELFEE